MEDGTKYDACGLRITNRNCGSGFDSCGDDVVVPSIEWGSAEEFMNDVPPRGFFDGGRKNVLTNTKGWKFKIVTPSELEAYGPDQLCFGSASMLTFPFIATLWLIIFSLY